MVDTPNAVDEGGILTVIFYLSGYSVRVLCCIMFCVRACTRCGMRGVWCGVCVWVRARACVALGWVNFI
jgi:uncharacterized membrane protein YwaF